MPMDAKPSRAAWLPLALCVVLTVIASGFVGIAQRQAEKARFANAVASARHRIEERMASYMGVLRGSAGLMSHDAHVTADEFHRFAERLKLREYYPGTQGLAYSARLPGRSVAEATARMRAEGWPERRIWPDTPRDEVHAIVLIEPLDARNRVALGFDMHTEPTRRETMDRARDRGEIALSGKVTLVQEIESRKQAGFLLYSPVYEGGAVPPTVEERRAKLSGFVYMPLRAGDLFEGIFGSERPSVAFELYDGLMVGDDTRLFAFGRAIDRHDHVAVQILAIAGHVWTARFVSAIASSRFELTLEVAALGLLLSTIVFFATRAREHARAREVSAKAAVLASEETLRLKDLFVGMLGHDLRSPLSAISISTEVLRSQLGDEKAATETLGRMRSSTRRMARMIEQMLDLTRVRLGGGLTLGPSPVELDALVRDVVDEIVRSNPAHLVEVTAMGDLAGSWDPDRLAQAFSNLIGNAVRYREAAPVRVTIDGTTPDRVVATVHNAGVIAPALLPVMFEPFRQRGARTRGAASGLGLGLFITRAIVDAHGGTIHVESCAADGTTFSVALPREPKARTVGVVSLAPLPPAA